MREKLAMACAATAFAFAAGCSGDSGPELMPGFEPLAPGPGQIQFIGPIVRDVAPGQDITLCSYLPIEQAFDQSYDITAGQGELSKLGGHHAVLSMVQSQRPEGTHVCNDDDMTNSRYLAGVGGGDAGVGPQSTIPEGLAFRVDGHQQLMIQSHWINTTDKKIDGQTSFILSVTPPTDAHAIAQLFTWTSTNINVPDGGVGSTHTTCKLKRDMSFYRMGGHAHEHGTHVKMTLTSAAAGADPVDNVFYDHAWESSYAFDPPMLEWSRDQAFVAHAGDSLSIDCDYANNSGSEIVFPLEMCSGFGFYFPGTVQADCTNGDWPAELN